MIDFILYSHRIGRKLGSIRCQKFGEPEIYIGTHTIFVEGFAARKNAP